MVLAEEYGRWEDSRRRIDLLCLDQEANLVVIELKRTEDGGHMDLQALRYAAMVSTMTFARAVEAHREYLKATNPELIDETEDIILRFLGWDEPQEEEFGNDVRIFLVSAEFSREITSCVLWLNERGIDIRCVRLKPYKLDSQVLLDVQQLVPLPEATDYQIQIREKAEQKRQRKSFNPDFTKFDFILDGEVTERLPKRRLLLETVRACIESGISPEQIAETMPRGMNRWLVIPGDHDAESFAAIAAEMKTDRGHDYHLRRWFCSDDELIKHDGRTLALHNQWGRKAPEVAKALAERWLSGRCEIRVSPED